MMCKQEANVLTNASWKFGFLGKISLLLDSQSRTWTPLDDEGKWLMEILTSETAMIDLLVKTSTWDCEDWLKHVVCSKNEALNTKGNSTEGMMS